MKVEKITIEQLADILEASIINVSANHGGMIYHDVEHPILGNVLIVQGVSDGGLLVS